METVCLLSKLHEAKHHVNVTLDMDELDITSAESKATYEEIIVEFEQLFESHKTRYITTVATDNILELAEGRADFKMSDEGFGLFVKYHLATCEKRELLGSSSHLLYVCKKDD